jgi:hypothetical protein
VETRSGRAGDARGHVGQIAGLASGGRRLRQRRDHSMKISNLDHITPEGCVSSFMLFLAEHRGLKPPTTELN